MTDNVSLLVETISEADIQHREAFWEYVLTKADPAYRGPLSRLLAVWEEANATYYDGALKPPIILLGTPKMPRVYGDCGPVSSWGARSQIRIRRSLLDGTHPHMQQGNGNPDGLFRFVADVLIHEQIHQWQQEITGKEEGSYHGHGPTFCEKANEIGEALGLEPVQVRTRPGHKGEPICPHWPENVRPADYYRGAYVRVPVNRDNREAKEIARCRAFLESRGYTVIAPEDQDAGDKEQEQ